VGWEDLVLVVLCVLLLLSSGCGGSGCYPAALGSKHAWEVAVQCADVFARGRAAAVNPKKKQTTQVGEQCSSGFVELDGDMAELRRAYPELEEFFDAITEAVEHEQVGLGLVCLRPWVWVYVWYRMAGCDCDGGGQSYGPARLAPGGHGAGVRWP
jgi:hypothetical protein